MGGWRAGGGVAQKLRRRDLTELTTPLILGGMVVAIKDKFCGIKEAAEVLGCTTGRVRQLILKGEIAGEKYGEYDNAPWLVDRQSLNKFSKIKPTTGRKRISETERADQ